MSEPSDIRDPHSDFFGRAVNGVIRFCMQNKLIVFMLTLALVAAGLVTMPFDYELPWIEQRAVPVDAIPDIGENQQIVFTEWSGRSPQDVEDQVTYPLTVSLLGVPGVKTIRSISDFGFSSVYVIFDEGVDFYWSRSRILERLSAAKKNLPEGVSPDLGPDATGLGQVFWYTLEGRDPSTGKPAGGWDLAELRSLQDWNVRYALQSAEGVSEVASIGGFVAEYQIDVDPDAMRSYGVTLDDVYQAVRKSNADVGARTIEINRVEYVIRGRGFIRSVKDVEDSLIRTRDNVPVYVKNVAKVSRGPALRRGALDKGGVDAVGGVVVVRYGENPLAVIKNVKDKIAEIAPGMAKKTLPDGRISQVTIVPFYDRTNLIHETLDTLENDLVQEILITVVVVIVMVNHLRASALISILLPLAVMASFVGMKAFGVDANLMSLAGIAIAIGTITDAGIIMSENILKHLAEADARESRFAVVYRAATEVGRPILTAILTTLIGFLPVFAMEGAEGKLFRPLVYAKTFALGASMILAITVIPPLAQLLLAGRLDSRWSRRVGAAIWIVGGVAAGVFFSAPLGIALALWGGFLAVRDKLPPAYAVWGPRLANVLAVIVVIVLVASHWMPLGLDKGFGRNLFFVAATVLGVLGFFLLFLRLYEPILRWFLSHKLVFYLMPITTLLLGLTIWLGFDTLFGWTARLASAAGMSESAIRESRPWKAVAGTFPGLGREFMPPLDEGSFLYMPVTMPHASIGEALDALSKQDRAIQAIPEVESVVGKIGRVESALDPAPVSMVETVVNYKPEYVLDDRGRPKLFRYENGDFVRNEHGQLVEDPSGKPYRQWRTHIRRPDDIWNEINQAAQLPGSTTASKIQPIANRIVMLQTGVRAEMAVRILGDRLEDIEQVGMAVEKLLKDVPSVNPATVIADRIMGKPYIEIEPDRQAIARYGATIRDVQDVIETAIGGQQITTTVEGRRRFPVRVRYQRELRDTIDSLGRVLVAGSEGRQIPLAQMAEIRYVRGPEMIKSEDTRLVGYVIFDKFPDFAQIDVVEACREYLDQAIADARLELPAGVQRPTFIGNYQNQIRSTKTLALLIPVSLGLIFIILYFDFKRLSTTLLIWSGVFVAAAGGMLLLWLYSTSWFLDVAVFNVNLRDMFQVHTINLSVAVWVGFIALMGIAEDDGVVISTYLDQTFRDRRPATIDECREATVRAGLRRIRPLLMTGSTTILALLPVLTSRGRGSDVMVPMAIPSVGGMTIELMTLFVVPVTYCLIEEWKLRRRMRRAITAEVVAQAPLAEQYQP